MPHPSFPVAAREAVNERLPLGSVAFLAPRSAPPGAAAPWGEYASSRLICTHYDHSTSTTLADLFTLLFAANPFSAARASLWRWSSDEFEDGLAHGGQCRSRRRPVDSFFPALLF